MYRFFFQAKVGIRDIGVTGVQTCYVPIEDVLRAARCLRSSMLSFFFSSRRRHTRYWRDWSSDVCSSDLRVPPDYDELPAERQEIILQRLAFASQRGWYYEEFGQKISAMMRENSTMADYRDRKSVV